MVRDCNAPCDGLALQYLTNFAGAYSRTDVKLVQPLWDFGKISAGVSAAEAGVTVTTGREAGRAPA